MPSAGINIENAWGIETGKPFIKVGVHDSGIDTVHSDLNVVFGGAYFAEDPTIPYEWGEDDYAGYGHGTPVAGIIGAKRDNATGIAGIAGGDSTGVPGCSMFDFRINFYDQGIASYMCASVVDAARSVGSYWDYPESYYDENPFFDHTPGFGIHIGNHSYVIRTNVPIPQDPPSGTPTGASDDGVDIDEEETGEGPWSGGSRNSLRETNDSIAINEPECELCREAYLFSLKNGVINVVARGNSQHFSASTDPTQIDYSYPQSFPDNWIISVGASGYDGHTVQNGVNQSQFENQTSYWSLYGGNMDLIAPGSDSIIYSTSQVNPATQAHPYTKFNGTSAAAPHVSGVVALLLGHYNKACYTNRNLSVEDVEYILERSATNLYGPGYDDTTGWGRLNAYKALQMIENPTLQIVHPDSLIETIEIVSARDTIALGYKNAFVGDGWGPISSTFPLEVNKEYEVVRYLIQNTYSFADYYSNTTDILGYWTRPSASNALDRYEDTTQYMAIGQPAGTLYTYTNFNFLDAEPFVEIVAIDSIAKTISTQGYYYHFINSYLELDLNDFGTTDEQVQVDFLNAFNVWYPLNPFIDTARMPVSIYISDTTLTAIYDFPCDMENPLYDENYDLGIHDTASGIVNFALYPNPTNTSVTIAGINSQSISRIEIFDLNGKRLYLGEPNAKQATIDVSTYQSGAYFVRCADDNMSKTLKLIIL